MTLALIDRSICYPPPPSLWATTPRGDIIGLHDARIVYHASNQAFWRLGSHAPCGIQTSYPETYTLTFAMLRSSDIETYLATDEARITVNDISFRIDSWEVESPHTIRYAATGWPLQLARTIPTDATACFPGWEDVGYEYLDDLDYDN